MQISRHESSSLAHCADAARERALQFCKLMLLGCVLIAGLIARPIDAHSFDDIDPKEIEAAIRNYLLAHPEVIFEAVDKHNAREEQAAAEAARAEIGKNKQAIYDEALAIVDGSADAPKAIVEFVDYNCSYCKKEHKEIKELLSEAKDVKLIVRQFPILSEGSLHASQIVLAAKQVAGNEAARKLHDSLYEFDGKINKTTALGEAKKQGLDVAAIEAKLESELIEAEIVRTAEIAQKLRIDGTPGFVVGEEIIRGFASSAVLKAFIANIKS